MTLAIGLLLLLSLVLPNVTLTEVRAFGSSLLLTGFYFLHVSVDQCGVDSAGSISAGPSGSAAHGR